MRERESNYSELPDDARPFIERIQAIRRQGDPAAILLASTAESNWPSFECKFELGRSWYPQEFTALLPKQQIPEGLPTPTALKDVVRLLGVDERMANDWKYGWWGMDEGCRTEHKEIGELHAVVPTEDELIFYHGLTRTLNYAAVEAVRFLTVNMPVEELRRANQIADGKSGVF